MNKMLVCVTSFSIAWLLVTSVATTGFAEESIENKPSLPEGCRQAIQKNVQALGVSDVVFAIERIYEPTPNDHLFVRAGNEKVRAVLDEGKFYCRQERSLTNRENDAPIIEESSFDGKVFYFGSLREHGGTSTIVRMLGEYSHDKDSEAKEVGVPYLRAAGFLVPQTVFEWRESAFDSIVLTSEQTGRLIGISENGPILTVKFEIPDSAVLMAKAIDLDKMEREVGEGGRESIRPMIDAYLKLRTFPATRILELTLDREKNYAVIRQEQKTMDGKLIQTTTCSDFELTKNPDLWLPRSCTVREFVKSPQLLNEFTEIPTLTANLSLKSISFSVPKDVSFELNYGPGTVVVERSTKAAEADPGHQLSYQIPATNEQAKKAAQKAAATFRPGLTLVIANAILLAVILIVYFRRRSQRQKA